jgi:hypothetical protein
MRNDCAKHKLAAAAPDASTEKLPAAQQARARMTAEAVLQARRAPASCHAQAMARDNCGLLRDDLAFGRAMWD